MGGGIGKALSSVANFVKEIAPLANAFFPGLGTALSAAAGLVETASGYVAKMEEKRDMARAEDRRNEATAGAAKADLARAWDAFKGAAADMAGATPAGQALQAVDRALGNNA
ncbi:MAG: hypothetical protein VKQ33_13445 [Candidatus Sericytochromatia bacterium]|nr:hypothetical protein [Candidatus Sericytochromatia bacterium]